MKEQTIKMWKVKYQKERIKSLLNAETMLIVAAMMVVCWVITKGLYE